jgi:DNA transposition AAA+ family ATPase
MTIVAPAPTAPAEHDYAAAAQIVYELADHLEQHKDRLGLSITACAQQIGIGSATLSKMLSGTRTNPTATTIIACLRWLAAQQK